MEKITLILRYAAIFSKTEQTAEEKIEIKKIEDILQMSQDAILREAVMAMIDRAK